MCILFCVCIFYLTLFSEQIPLGDIDFMVKYSIVWMDAVNICVLFAFILFPWHIFRRCLYLDQLYKYFIILLKVTKYTEIWHYFGPSQFLEYF